MRYVRDCSYVLATSQGEDEPGKALRRHSRGDGLSSPWGGVVALTLIHINTLKLHFMRGQLAWLSSVEILFGLEAWYTT